MKTYEARYLLLCILTVCDFVMHTLMDILMKLNSFRNMDTKIIGKWVSPPKFTSL
ncbi:hypothetical protein BDZ91DRAFT_714579 [Kalaharituber pfeilii]|nr:hypothetical protein BDZ91DRAFT_714579 [Kalaharituber pfeilii]